MAAAVPTASWPGVRAVAQFDGTSASVKLSQTNGFSGGPTWFDVWVDGALGTPFSVSGSGEDHVVATGLAAGTHTVEIVKRTEANLGAVSFEGFTFPGGKLLAPPARAAHKIEFLSDSTIDGFGVEGNVATTCGAGSPAQFNDADKSTAAFASKGVSADMMLLAYSGKGITKNEDGTTTDVFGDLYARTLPDSSLSWSFASFTPDVVVISLGGADLGATNVLPAGFTTAYGALVDTIRGHYPNAHVFMTIWSQIKAYNGARQAMEAGLQSVLSAHASDTKLYLYEFPEANHDTDETGCEYHANEAHHQAMGALLAAQIKAKTGW